MCVQFYTQEHLATHTHFNDFVLHNNPFVQLLAMLFCWNWLIGWRSLNHRLSLYVIVKLFSRHWRTPFPVNSVYMRSSAALMQCIIPTTRIIICASLKHCYVLGMLFRYNNRFWYLPESLPQQCYSMQPMCMSHNNAIHFTPCVSPQDQLYCTVPSNTAPPNEPQYYINITPSSQETNDFTTSVDHTGLATIPIAEDWSKLYKMIVK